MVLSNDLQKFLDDYLNCSDCADYCPNGLQIEGKKQIKKIITGVTASQELIDASIAKNADAIIVHHGYFWKNESPTIVGIKYKRIKTLINADINLFAYHLPLDKHTEIGNNATLGKILGIKDYSPTTNDLLRFGSLANAVDANEFTQYITKTIGRAPTHIKPSTNLHIQKIAWCTGGAQGLIEQAVELQVDAYISGEISEQTTHIAKENNIHYFAIGHHASERYGIQALGNILKNRFDVEVEYIEINNPA